MIKHKKKVAVLAAVSALVVGSAMSGSAFFTDKEVITKNTKVGTMDMVVRDLSDLDGQYRNWLTQTGIIGTGSFEEVADDNLSTYYYVPGYQSDTLQYDDLTGKANDLFGPYDKDNPSTGIINPGDTGLLAFAIKNTREKSFDVALEVIVESSIPLTNGADEYTIDGLGKPAKSADGKTLTYLKILDTFDGSIEKETGGKSNDQEHLYVYHADFARTADEKFMKAEFTVTTNIYAKQHRNSVASSFRFAEVSGGSDSNGNSWTYASKKQITGDWTLVDQKIDLGENSGSGNGDIVVGP